MAEVELIPVAVTPEITGGAGVVVVKVELVDVVDALEPFTETTSKSYNVAGVNPLRVTECEVTSALLSSDCEP